MRIVLLISLMVNFHFLVAQNLEADIRKKQFNLTETNLAVSGYDVVSYFSGKPKMGSKTFFASYKGINYYFSSQVNLDLFKKSPDKFIPSYGGWCAYAMGNSAEKVEVDPETFKIIEGKLYLFYNAYFTNTLTKWNKDEKNLKTKADKNWQLIYK